MNIEYTLTTYNALAAAKMWPIGQADRQLHFLISDYELQV